MAKVQDVNLTMHRSGSDFEVTVNGSLVFEGDELGKSYRLAIELYGVDKPGEPGEGPLVVLNPRPRYTFTFGSFWNRREYQTITAADQEQTFSYTRTVNDSVLDEDPGYSEIEVLGRKYRIPYPDEIRASVSLGLPLHVASSPAVTITA